MKDDIRKMLDDTYDDSREDSIRSMIGDFYSRRMLSTAVTVWVMGGVFLVGAIYIASLFFATDEVQLQIMYAAIFICLLNLIGLLKIFSWQIVHRNGIKREIKRLEIRVAELAKSLDK